MPNTFKNRQQVTRSSHSPFTISLIIAVFIFLGMVSSIINPLHEATDELRHYRFVRHIVQLHYLPIQGELACSAQGHHPPLFYAIGAAATFWIDTGRDVCYEPPTNPFWAYRYWDVGNDNKNQYLHGADESFPWHGEALAAHIVRAINVLIGAGVVWLTWAIARAICPDKPALAAGACAFVAFNPMFIYMAGSINNDVIAALSGAGLTLACVRLLRDESGLSRRWGVVLGVWFGVALMSKFNLAAVAVLIETAVLWTAFKVNKGTLVHKLRLWLEVNLLIALFTLLIAGWWFGRNQLLYGEPTGFEKVTELWGVRDPLDPSSWGTAVFELPYAWTSLWGRFGYGQIPLPDSFYLALRYLVGFSLLGLPLPLLSSRFTIHDSHSSLFAPLSSLLFLALNVALFFAVLFGYLLVSPAGPMGRFFFPALPALAILTFYGLSNWVALLPSRFTFHVSHLAALTNLAMLAFTLVALFGYLAPAFAKPETFGAETAVPNLTNAQFDTLVNLRGYTLSPTSLHPGEPVHIQLYWQVTNQPPGNYLLFVHLRDELGNIIAQRDTHPGLGNFPSSLWQPDDHFIEDLTLYVPETAYAPVTATLQIGLYAADGSYRLGITGQDGAGLGDALTLGSVEIVPKTAEFPNPQITNFENEVQLVGYEYNQRDLQPEDTLTVTLYWQGLVSKTATVQVQLRANEGAAWDTWVESETQPTWQIGQITQDTHFLQLPPNLPPGSYIIHVALIDDVTKEAQNIVAEDGHLIDNQILLGRVRVQPH